MFKLLLNILCHVHGIQINGFVVRWHSVISVESIVNDSKQSSFVLDCKPNKFYKDIYDIQAFRHPMHSIQTVFSNLIRQCWHLLLHFFHSHNIHQNDNITQSQRIRDHFQCEWTLFESQYRYLLAIELLNLNSQPNGRKEESNRMAARRKATEWPQERKQHLKLTDGINILMEFHR